MLFVWLFGHTPGLVPDVTLAFEDAKIIPPFSRKENDNNNDIEDAYDTDDTDNTNDTGDTDDTDDTD